MSQDKSKKRIFWLEGVTRGEVEKSLSDRTPSRFRQQRPRRMLVLVASVVLAANWLVPLIAQHKFSTYLSFALLLAIIGLYLKLRSAVRHVSDAPDELLDEWQIGARNTAYLWAYRWLALVMVVHVMFVTPAIGEGFYPESARNTLHIGLVMLAAILPAMVLAWRLPSEPSDPSEPSEPSEVSE